MKQALASRDGRMAYFLLKDHYLGAHAQGHIATTAEEKLASMSYFGEKKNWTMDKMCTTLTDLF